MAMLNNQMVILPWLLKMGGFSMAMLNNQMVILPWLLKMGGFSMAMLNNQMVVLISSFFFKNSVVMVSSTAWRLIGLQILQICREPTSDPSGGQTRRTLTSCSFFRWLRTGVIHKVTEIYTMWDPQDS